MTWGECKLAALQTMFSNEGADLQEDDTNKEYIDAMPAKVNEALQQACLAGRPLVKKFSVTVSGTAQTDTVVPGVSAVLPAQAGLYHLDMSALAPRFRCLNGGAPMLETENGYGEAQNWHMEGDTVLVIPADVTGEYTVWYRAYPEAVTAVTADDAVLDVPAEMAALLPLYIASQLYKDDDLSMATMWRNEWEDGLEKVRDAYGESSGITVTKRINTTGWW